MKPIVLLPCCKAKDEKNRPVHRCGEKYLTYTNSVLGCTPLCLPALSAEELDLEAILALIDGLFLTGSPSHLDPRTYNAQDNEQSDNLDTARDSTTLPLIRKAVEKGIPLFGVCRGLQEINVALGGTLKNDKLDHKKEHRAPKTKTPDEAYKPRHKIHIKRGGLLEKILKPNAPKTYKVNSLHEQAIAKLAPSLFVEAVSNDATIEAISNFQNTEKIKNAEKTKEQTVKAFLFAVQWHPEHALLRFEPISQTIGNMFRNAVMLYQQKRL